MIANEKTLAMLRDRYPKGSKVELIFMDDPQAPDPGTTGTVIGVDDTGSILVNWDNGCSLNALYKVDKVRRICPVCGSPMPEYPALSRRDNKTEICSECGIREAIDDFFCKEKTNENIQA